MQKTGSIPNLYWTSISQDALRADKLYTPLPPVQHVYLNSSDSYRMVRQDTDLWTKLHKGVLTTGKLNACLGFYETKAAKRLKIGGGFADHNALLHAWRHLQDFPYIPRGYQQVSDYHSGIMTSSISREVKLRKSRLRAAAGPASMRMAWGTAQEASALYSLMHVFPKSHLLECGLFQINVDKLPREWGFKPGDLPPLGASPDGLFHHSSLPDMEDNIAGTEAANGFPQAQPPGTWMQFPPGLRHGQGGQGMCGADMHAASQTTEEAEIRKLLATIDLNRAEDRLHPLSEEGWLQAQRNGILEVVEVKNRSPFHRSRSSNVYHLSDEAPVLELQPMWVPQVQLEMLASECQSALLVRRSVLQGLTIFRVFRDDTYLRHMLTWVKQFYQKYVKTGHRPPKDVFYDNQDYQALITLTLGIARNSKKLAWIPHPQSPPDADLRPFLE